MIKITQTGNFKHTERFFKTAGNLKLSELLNQYGREGVAALAAATPVDTGKTADSWSYKITKTPYEISIEWFNTNIVNGVPIAIVLQYGHVTGTGGYVQGRDYINPAMRPVFDKISNAIWKEVTDA